METDRVPALLPADMNDDANFLVTAWRSLSQGGGSSADWEAFLEPFVALGEAGPRTLHSILKAAAIDGTYWSWCDTVVGTLRLRPDTQLLEPLWPRLFCLRLGQGAIPSRTPPATSTLNNLCQQLADTRDSAGFWRLGPLPDFAGETAPPAELAALFRGALGRVAQEPAGGALPGDVLALASLIAGHGGSETDESVRPWALPLHQRLCRGVAANTAGSLRRVQYSLSLLLIETLLIGRAQAIVALAQRLIPESSTTLTLLGEFLFRVGLYRGLTASDWDHLRASVPRGQRGALCWSLLFHVGNLAPATWNRWVLDHWVWPLIRERCETGDFSALQALAIPIVVVQKQPFSEPHWRAVGDPFIAAVEEAADRLVAGLGNGLPLAPLADSLPLRIAFVSTNLTTGPAVATLALFMRPLVANFSGELEVHVVFMVDRPPSPSNRNVQTVLERLGAKVHWLTERAEPTRNGMDGTVAATAILRHALHAAGICVAVFFDTSTVFAIVASTARVAPVQLYWSMGFDWPAYRHMDGLFSTLATAEGLRKSVTGRIWHPVRHLYRPLIPADAQTVATVRSRFAGYRRVLGTVCRSEKLNSPAFIAVLGRLLRRYPDVCYLWTGQKNADVVALMAQEGVAGQCFFCGWVNPAEYTPAIDIFLETFPQSNGLAPAEAMSIGKPVISRVSSYAFCTFIFEPARQGWYGPEEQQAFEHLTADPDGDSLYLLAKDDDEYERMARRLIEDIAFYRLAGEAAKTLAYRYLFNGRASAESLVAAVRDVVAEVRHQPLAIP